MFVEHAELQKPEFVVPEMHQPFTTGPLPVGLPMDEDGSYDDLNNQSGDRSLLPVEVGDGEEPEDRDAEGWCIDSCRS